MIGVLKNFVVDDKVETIIVNGNEEIVVLVIEVRNERKEHFNFD